VTLQKLLVATDAAEASPLTIDHAVQLAQLGARLNALGEKLKGPRRVCQAKVRVGIPYEEILDEAEQMAAELILLGHKAAPGLGRFLLGSTAERVVRHASCSVFVARRRPVNGP
jgi:nucleotide-binding universal stress UspA family protein